MATAGFRNTSGESLLSTDNVFNGGASLAIDLTPWDRASAAHIFPWDSVKGKRLSISGTLRIPESNPSDISVCAIVYYIDNTFIQDWNTIPASSRGDFSIDANLNVDERNLVSNLLPGEKPRH